MRDWYPVERPGYFGKRRDQKIAALNEKYGTGNWKLAWKFGTDFYDFVPACRYFYERSYFEFFTKNRDALVVVCQFRECMDNAETNVNSGMDYSIQEAVSTHIQDIAVRNVLHLMGHKFTSQNDSLLVIRGEDSNGQWLNPGHIPFFDQFEIGHPSLAPFWVKPHSVEDFWQSNKWVVMR